MHQLQLVETNSFILNDSARHRH